jgi:hypothetical protein
VCRVIQQRPISKCCWDEPYFNRCVSVAWKVHAFGVGACIVLYFSGLATTRYWKNEHLANAGVKLLQKGLLEPETPGTEDALQ